MQVHNHAKVEKTSATCNTEQQAMVNLVRGQPSRLVVLETWDGWLIAGNIRTIFLSCKINWYFMVIYILRLYCFFKSFDPFSQHNKRIFAASGEYFKQSFIPSHPKNRLVNVCEHKFECTNVTPKRRNEAHFITQALHCAWVKKVLQHGIFVFGHHPANY